MQNVFDGEGESEHPLEYIAAHKKGEKSLLWNFKSVLVRMFTIIWSTLCATTMVNIIREDDSQNDGEKFKFFVFHFQVCSNLSLTNFNYAGNNSTEKISQLHLNVALIWHNWWT